MSDTPKRSGPEPVVPLKDGDAFWLTDLYPDAKALFEHEQVSLDVASQECIVVLDANVLLLPFEFTQASVAEVERVYTELCSANRLVVPGQAAREFYKNRSNKLTAIADAIDAVISKAKKQIFEKSIPLLEDDADYLDARELGKDFVNKGKEIAKKLEAVNERLKDEVGADRVSLLYRKLLGGCVVDIPLGDEERKEISAEVARRARLKIAPGFKDQQKEDGGIGDYLIWQTILQEGAKRKVHCIFVTEEEKPDWWIKRHGTFQPRPELVEEYRRASEGKSFHLAPLSGLLASFKASEDVVKQVQDIEETKKKVVVEVTRRRVLDKSSEAMERRIAIERAKERLSQLQHLLSTVEAAEQTAIDEWSDHGTPVARREWRRNVERLRDEREAITRQIEQLEHVIGFKPQPWPSIVDASVYQNYLDDRAENTRRDRYDELDD